MSTIENSRFLRRFDDVWMRLKRVGLLKAVSLGGLLAIIGLALLVVCDYTFELPRGIRTAGLATTVFVSSGVLFSRVIREYRRWNERHTAATIEKNFPELGQSVRTAIEFGRTGEDDLKNRGVVPGLVEAMQQQTDRITLPLDLLGMVKTGGLILMVGALCFLLGGLITGSAVNWEWQTALRRAFLIEVPYTTATSPSGNLTVIEGETAVLSLQVDGRTDREITLFTRPADDTTAEWQTQILTADDQLESNSDHYQVAFAEVDQAFDYRFSAGPAATDSHRVTVKYPLRIEEVNVTLTPPEYTRLEPVTKTNTSVSAIENSKAVFDVKFDRPAASASLMLKPLRSANSETGPMELPLVSNGQSLTAELDIAGDWRFVVHATDEDDIPVESPEYSIRMRSDQAPRIWFEEPSEELEVHTLAEVMLRIRVTDDFGLANAGIVFEINNETEHTLTSKDFTAATDVLAEDGPLTPKKRETLERLLPLEFFELTQRDSVNYYAYAEDNYPSNPHRTTTDLRFVDIRPFRRTYRVIDPDDPMGMPSDRERLILLDELLKRERALLNRTRRVAKRAEAGMPPDTTTTSSLIEEQQKIADATLRLVNFLISRDIGGDELLFDAHEVMLTTIDALAAGRFDDSVALERDAIKLLVEGRDTLRQLIRKNPAKARAALRQFSRREKQKLRRPKSDEEEVAELVERLRQLKADERQVSMAMSAFNGSNGQNGNGQNGTNGNGENGANGQPQDTQPDGNEDPDPEEMQNADDMRRETEDRQNDIALEARDIESKMQDIEMLTDLARERMADAASAAEQSAAAMERKDNPQAMKSADEAEQKFGQVADQVEALLRDEIAQRIAAARDLANRLAQQQQRLQSAMQGQQGQNGQMGQNGQNGQQGQNGDGQNENGDPTDPEAKDQEDGDDSDGQDDSDKDNDNNGSDDSLDAKAGDQNSERPENEDGKGGKSDSEQPDSEDSGGDDPDSEDLNKDKPRASENEDAESDQQGGGKGEAERKEEVLKALAAIARQLEEEGKTLEDLLKAIARSDREQDQEAAGDVAKILEDQQISATLKQMGELTQMVSRGAIRGATTLSADVQNRMELTGQDLERLHRRIVAPRIDQLMKLERRAAALLKKAQELETKEAVAQWRMAARQLLDELNDAQLSGDATKQLEDALRTVAGRNSLANATTNGFGSTTLTNASRQVVEDLQQRIQELVLGDVIDQSNEAVPPEYERFVERYYQVLSDADKGE